MSVEQKLKKIEEKIKSISEDKVRKTEQLRLLREQRDKLKEQITAEGLTPQTLSPTIESLKQEIDQDIANLETQIPQI